MRHLSLIALAALTFALPATATAAVGPAYNSGTYGYVCTHNANGTVLLRAGAGQNYKVLARMPNGTDVSVLRQANAKDGFVWYNISYGRLKGWARSDYICG